MRRKARAYVALWQRYLGKHESWGMSELVLGHASQQQAEHTVGEAPPAPPADRPPRSAPPRGWWLALGFFLLYCAIALFRHLEFASTGYDLGIFEQAVRSYSELKPPIVDLKGPGFNLLGDHFSPILVLIAPLYRLFPFAITLLIVQSALLASSVVPIATVASSVLGRRRGLIIGAAYGLSWGIQQAVWFDFHEIAFAVPLTAWVVSYLVRRQWLRAALWSLPLLLVKEDQFLTVALVGGYIFLRGRRRTGALLAGFAVAMGLLTIYVFIPHANSHAAYAYFDYAQQNGTGQFARLFLPTTKWVTVLWLLAATGFIALRSPIILLCLPTLAWRFWGTNPNYWGMDFHYSATLMPILFAAMVDGLSKGPIRLKFGIRPGRRMNLAVAPNHFIALAVACATVWTALVTVDHIDIFRAARPWSELTAARHALAVIPDGAKVAADNRLVPQLTNRCDVYLFPAQFPGSPKPELLQPGFVELLPSTMPPPEWIAVDTLDGPGWTVPADEIAAIVLTLPGRGYSEVASGGGVAIYHRQAD
jgi:uncharacterized membrane protein